MLLGVISGFITLHISLRKSGASLYKKTMYFAAVIFIPFIAGALFGGMAENIFSPRLNDGFGTFSLWWGFAAACAASFLITKQLKINVWETGDFLAPSIAIGFFFVKIGCLLNGCCFGNECEKQFPFPLYYPSGSGTRAIFGDNPVYPAQIVEAISWLFIFLILLFTNRKPDFKGRQILIIFTLYPVARFLINFIRYYPEKQDFLIAQGWCLITLFLTITALFYIKKTKNSG